MTSISGPRVALNTDTQFLMSTSGSESSLKKHNRALQQLGLNMVYYAIKHDISPDVYAGLVRSPIVRGAAVTAKGGLKSSIIPFLDEVEPLAQKTLAVNTVIHDNGRLHGYNTDIHRLRTALQTGLDQANTRIETAVIYGNGGVSGAAFYVLQDMGLKVTMVGQWQTSFTKATADSSTQLSMVPPNRLLCTPRSYFLQTLVPSNCMGQRSVSGST